MASPVPTLKIWAFYVKSGKAGPLGTRQLSSREAAPWQPRRRLEGANLPLPLAPSFTGVERQVPVVSFVLCFPTCLLRSVFLVTSSIGGCLRCRLLGFRSRLSLLAL